MTLRELKALAKERGLRGYSRLRKAELIHLLNTTRPIPAPRTKTKTKTRPIPAPKRTLLDRRMPNINVPVLKPEVVTTKPSTIGKVVEKSITTVNDWLDWLRDSGKKVIKKVSPKVEDLKQKISSLFKKRETFEVRQSRSALREFATVNTIEGRDGYDPESFLRAVRQTVTNLLRNNHGIKVKLVLNCNMEMTSIVRGTVIEPSSFHSIVEVNLEGTNVDELYNTMVARILENIATFQMRGSQWLFHSIISLEVHTFRYEPLRGSSYIPLPKKISSKKAIINIKNEDDMCFKWAVARACHSVERDAERITKLLREQAEELNMKGIEFPVKLKDIDKFEKQNPTISINVFGYQGTPRSNAKTYVTSGFQCLENLYQFKAFTERTS